MTRQDCLNKILLLSDQQLEELINSHEAQVEKKQLGGPFNYINPAKAPQAIQAINEDPNVYILENVYPSTYTDTQVWSDLLSNSKGNLQMVNKYAPLFLKKGKEYYQGLEDTTDEDPSASSPDEDKMTLWTIPNNAVWSHYLGHDDFMPEGTRFQDLFPVSQYKPTIAKDENAIYYSDPYLKYNPHILADLLYAKEYGANDHKFRDMLMNDYTATLGEDEKGKYYSYYDKWNINPFRGSEALPIGSWFGLDKYDDISEFTNLKTQPVEFYDRFYYTPEMEQEAREIMNSYIPTQADPNYVPTEEEQQQMLQLVLNSKANWVQRLINGNKKLIKDWEDPNQVASHKLSYFTDNGKVYVFPAVQEINGELIDFTNPINSKYGDRFDSAIKNGDYVIFPNTNWAAWFTADNYKKFFDSTKKYTSKKANGGVLNLEEELQKILPTDEYLKLTIKNYSEFNKL